MSRKSSYKREKDILTGSPLWKSLLSDKEIRYSDFLGLFIEKYKFNPFTLNHAEKYIVHREKKHTDLWINEIIPVIGDEIERPRYLIENKLKSLPYVSQLTKYTEIFVNEYIKSFREEYRRNNSVTGPVHISKIRKDRNIADKLDNVQNDLKFYLLSPLRKDLNPVKIKCPSAIKSNSGEYLEFRWHPISYNSIGDTIKSKVPKNSHSYIDLLFNDFANILSSMTIFIKELDILVLKN